MKHILFNYFLTSDTLFKEKRMVGQGLGDADGKKTDAGDDLTLLDDPNPEDLPYTEPGIDVDGSGHETYGKRVEKWKTEAKQARDTVRDLVSKNRGALDYHKNAEQIRLVQNKVLALNKQLDALDQYKNLTRDGYQSLLEDVIELSEFVEDSRFTEPPEETRELKEKKADLAVLKRRYDSANSDWSQLKTEVNALNSELADLMKSPQGTSAIERPTDGGVTSRKEFIRQLAEYQKTQETQLDAYITGVPAGKTALTKLAEAYTDENSAEYQIGLKRLRDQYRPQFLASMARDKDKLVRPDKVMDISQRVRENDVNPDDFKFGSEPQLLTTVDIFINKLGLPQDTVLWMASELRFAFDGRAAAKYGADSPMVAMLKNPDEHMDEIQKDKSLEGFFAAYLFFQNVKFHVTSCRNNLSASSTNAAKANEDPIATKVMDFTSNTLSDFTNAVHDRDYTKLGLYGVLAYGLFKLYQNNKDAGKSDWFKYAVYGAGIYAGVSLFAPKVAKEFWGKGKNVDLKGTFLEDLESAKKTNGAEYMKALETTSLFRIRELKVKDVYSTITKGYSGYDEDASVQNMVQLNAPGFEKCFDKDMIDEGYVSPATLNAGRELTAQQKLYKDAAKGLYGSLVALQTFYEREVQQSAGGVSFEDYFLNEKSSAFVEGRTMTDLYAMCKQSAAHAPDLLDKDTDKQAREDLFFSEKAAGFREIGNIAVGGIVKPGVVGCRICDFPVQAEVNMDAGTKHRTYRFYLGGDGERTEVTQYKVGTDSGTAAEAIKAAVQAKLVQIVEGAGIIDGKKLYYSNGRWGYDVERVKAFGSEKVEEKFVIDINANGRAIAVKTAGGKTFATVDRDIPQNDHEILSDIFVSETKSDFHQLSVVQKLLHPTDVTPDSLTLRLGSLRIGVTYDKPDTPPFKIDPDSEALVLKSEDFQREYAKARYENEETAGLIESAKGSLENIDEEWVSSTFQNMVGAAKGENNWSDIMNGSTNESLVEVLIRSRLEMFKILLKKKVGASTSFADLATNETDVSDRYSRLKLFVEELSTLSAGGEVDKAAFENFIQGNALYTGVETPLYLDAVKYFESKARPELTNVLKSKRDAFTKLMSKFYEYTADLDVVGEIDTSTLDGRKEHNTREKYFRYVTGGILKKVNTEKVLRGIPIPESEIKPYSKFRLENGAAPLNAMNVSPRYDNADLLKRYEILPRAKMKLETIRRDYPQYYFVAQAVYTKFKTTNGKFDQFANEVIDYEYNQRSQQLKQIDDYIDQVFAYVCTKSMIENYKISLKGDTGAIAWMEEQYLNVTGKIFPTSK